jgi:hypothetical protein
VNLTIHTAFADNGYELDYVLDNFKDYYAKRLQHDNDGDNSLTVMNSIKDVCEDLDITCHYMGDSNWVFTNKSISYDTLAQYWE